MERFKIARNNANYSLVDTAPTSSFAYTSSTVYFTTNGRISQTFCENLEQLQYLLNFLKDIIKVRLVYEEDSIIKDEVLYPVISLSSKLNYKFKFEVDTSSNLSSDNSDEDVGYYDIRYSNYYMSLKSDSYNEYYSNHNKLFEPVFRTIYDKNKLTSKLSKYSRISLNEFKDFPIANNYTTTVPLSYVEAITYDVNYDGFRETFDINTGLEFSHNLQNLKQLYIIPEYYGVDYTLRIKYKYKGTTMETDIVVTDKTILKLPSLADQIVACQRLSLIADEAVIDYNNTQVTLTNYLKDISGFIGNPHYNRKVLETIEVSNQYLNILDINGNILDTFKFKTQIPSQVSINNDLVEAGNLTCIVDEESTVYIFNDYNIFTFKLHNKLNEVSKETRTTAEPYIDTDQISQNDWLLVVDTNKFCEDFGLDSYVLKIGNLYYDSITELFVTDYTVNNNTVSNKLEFDYELFDGEPVYITLTDSEDEVLKQTYIKIQEVTLNDCYTDYSYYSYIIYAEDCLIEASKHNELMYCKYLQPIYDKGLKINNEIYEVFLNVLEQY